MARVTCECETVSECRAEITGARNCEQGASNLQCYGTATHAQRRGLWLLLVDQPRLRREPDRRVGRAVARVSAPLHDLEKEPLFEASGVDLQVLAVSIAVVEDIVGPQ